MLFRFAVLALMGLSLSAGHAQASPPLPDAPAPAPKPTTVRVALQTSLGPIVLELEKERAPVTTANFLRYVDEKRFDGIAFYRATKIGEGYGLIQGGAKGDAARVLPPIAHEPTSKTGLSHVDGAISMARYAPGTADADFFITIGDLESMDADPAQPGDNQGFAVFGRVVEGMDVVRRILAAPTSPTEGEGVMKGQMLASPVRIVSAARAE
ncbi:peptidylprolyl isomerase [Enterovirga sp. GCM10030262]|uniref:peptidylprolyl isomerase n=1 Tax=Enterovirga sp. GCM10030262 TaxID=3273391 RepID=UPI00361316C4